MLADLRAAFAFLTILPLGTETDRKPGWSFSWYPLVGLVIGLLLALIALVAPFEGQTTAFLILLTWVVVTGGLHLDGLADSCDGLSATVSAARRLEIMKDPRTGSWAVIGLILLLLGKWILLQTLPPALLILPPIVGRWVMVAWLSISFPMPRTAGAGAYFLDGLGPAQVAVASAIAFVGIVLIARQFTPVLIVFVARRVDIAGGRPLGRTTT